jgi:hypothetical protein
MSGVRRRSILAATSLLLLCLGGCQGGTLLAGKITDIAGKPVTAAMVTLEVVDGSFPGAKNQSNDQGAYQIHVAHYPRRTELIVTVSKEGFEPFKQKFTSKGTQQHLDVKLKPLDAANMHSSR